jgi:hypothetical protein
MNEVHYFAARGIMGFQPFWAVGDYFTKLRYPRRCGEPAAAAPRGPRQWSALQVARAILRDALEQPALADELAEAFASGVIEPFERSFLLTAAAVRAWAATQVRFAPSRTPEEKDDGPPTGS